MLLVCNSLGALAQQSPRLRQGPARAPQSSDIKERIIGATRTDGLSLQAERGEGTEVRLEWSLPNATDVAGYEIQYSSDSLDFQVIGTLSANSPLYGDQSYVFSVEETGAMYYRIRQINFDGTECYSQMRFVPEGRPQTPWEIYPLQVGDLLYVRTYPGEELPVLQLTTEKGKPIEVPIQMGNQLQTLSLRSIPRGIYILHLADPKTKKEHTQQIVKQ